ncbi:MAG: hypothetical protein P8Z37_12485 [Acidobacteriota bacterium]|jgi:hypothetical protein
MNNQKMLKPAAIGGLLLGILSALPIASCGCCIWMIGGGVLAAYLFVKESPSMVTLGQGVLLGLFAGIIGTVVFGLFQIPLLLISPETGTEVLEQVEGFMNQWPGIPPESREEFRKLATSESFITIMYVSSLIAQLVAGCILAMIGGGLGVAIFEKRKNNGSVHNQPPAEPPSHLPPAPPEDPSN